MSIIIYIMSLNNILKYSFNFNYTINDANLIKLDDSLYKQFILVEKDGIIKFGMKLKDNMTVRIIEKNVNDVNDYKLSDTIKIVAILLFETFPSMDRIGEDTYSVLSSLAVDDDRVVTYDPIVVKIDQNMAKEFVLIENGEGVWFGLTLRNNKNNVKIVDKQLTEFQIYPLSDSVKIVAKLNFITFPSLEFII